MARSDARCDDAEAARAGASEEEPSAWGEPRRSSVPDGIRHRRQSPILDVSAGLRNSLGIFAVEEAVWQWEHRKGWRNYKPEESRRIERAYQLGQSHVRLKSGKAGEVPMEIFFADMLQFDPVTERHRPVQRVGPDPFRQQVRRYFRGWWRALETGQPRTQVFAQYAKNRMAQLKENLDEKDYNVMDLYAETGFFAKTARSDLFWAFTMLFVSANLVWVAVDAQHNKTGVITEADVEFQVLENVFCVYFLAEIAIRFLAFADVQRGTRDRWFIYDSAIVVATVVDVWLIPLLLFFIRLGGADNPTLLVSIARLLRLAKLGRTVRVLRLVPEILTLLKGIGIAIRSVFFTVVMLSIILYVFGIMFKHQAADVEGLDGELFLTIPNSMWKLLLHGTFLDDVAPFLDDIRLYSGSLAALFVLFIFLSNYMITNMVIGIICEVVAQVSRTEHEETAVAYLKDTILDILDCHDVDDDRQIREEEFEALMKNQEVHHALTAFGVDVNDLLSMKEVFFQNDLANKLLPSASDNDSPEAAGQKNLAATSYSGMSAMEEGRQLSFADFLEVVLRLRGGNSAKVTDIVELREFVRRRLNRIDLKLPEDTPPVGVGEERGEGKVVETVAACRLRDAGAADRRPPTKPVAKDPLDGSDWFGETSMLAAALQVPPSSAFMADGNLSPAMPCSAAAVTSQQFWPQRVQDDGILAMLQELCGEQRELHREMKGMRRELDGLVKACGKPDEGTG